MQVLLGAEAAPPWGHRALQAEGRQDLLALSPPGPFAPDITDNKAGGGGAASSPVPSCDPGGRGR